MRMMRKVSTLIQALEHLDETDMVYSVDGATGVITELHRSVYLACQDAGIYYDDGEGY